MFEKPLSVTVQGIWGFDFFKAPLFEGLARVKAHQVSLYMGFEVRVPFKPTVRGI